MMEFKSFRSASDTLQGIELMQMIKKGRMVSGDSQDMSPQVSFIGRLKGREGSPESHSKEISATEPRYFNAV